MQKTAHSTYWITMHMLCKIQHTSYPQSHNPEANNSERVNPNLYTQTSLMVMGSWLVFNFQDLKNLSLVICISN